MNNQATPRSSSELQAVHAARAFHIDRSGIDGHLIPMSNDERLTRFNEAKRFNQWFGSTPKLQIIKA